MSVHPGGAENAHQNQVKHFMQLVFQHSPEKWIKMGP